MKLVETCYEIYTNNVDNISFGITTFYVQLLQIRLVMDRQAFPFRKSCIGTFFNPESASDHFYVHQIKIVKIKLRIK